MRILAERDGLYFLDLDCQGCGSQTVAIVTIEMDDAEASIADLSIVPQRLPPADMPPPGSSAVSADDVLEMHEFLAKFDGNVSHLLRAATVQFRTQAPGELKLPAGTADLGFILSVDLAKLPGGKALR